MNNDPYSFLGSPKGEKKDFSSPGPPRKLYLKSQQGKPEPSDYRCYEEVGSDGATALRLVLVKRNGHRYSFPYSHMGLIEMPSSDLIVIHQVSGDAAPIVIKGRGLSVLTRLLDLQRLMGVWEVSHADLSDSEVCVQKIEIEG